MLCKEKKRKEMNWKLYNAKLGGQIPLDAKCKI